MPKSMAAREHMGRKLYTRRRVLYIVSAGSRSNRCSGKWGTGRAGYFSMRGLDRCRGERQLDAAIHNLRKLHR
jgi:hypothetical protein